MMGGISMVNYETVNNNISHLSEVNLEKVALYVQNLLTIQEEEEFPNKTTLQALDDDANDRNISGPFDSISSLMEDLNA